MKGRALISVFLLTIILSTYAQDYKYGPAEKDYIGYLFTYFKGNDVNEEAVCFAVSLDGYNYLTLNNNQPVLQSNEISSTGGVRDPILSEARMARLFIWW
ncbi:hypothetical protein [Sphingobacterium pedocola]|uniref:hypothetical protein n=1 Tax=Sphingobacterium pedocola TaxID=2082722 RepID=UPI001E2E6D53|nr:hypothetical protein [Sphingobacterium pedocola]